MRRLVINSECYLTTFDLDDIRDILGRTLAHAMQKARADAGEETSALSISHSIVKVRKDSYLLTMTVLTDGDGDVVPE